LNRNGVKAIGLDSNQREVERARGRGLPVTEGDARDYLINAAQEFSGVSLIEVIEHLPFDEIGDVIGAAASKLVPGGVLLIEIINIRHPVGAELFYTDPTHHRPVTEGYITFLMEWHGLEDIKVVYTSPVRFREIDNHDVQRTYCIYAVIGRRPGGAQAAAKATLEPAQPCAVCGSHELVPAALKFGVAYTSCKNCGVVACGVIDESVILTQNDAPEGRANESLQLVRLERIAQQLGRKPGKMLDFGCGRGDFVRFLQGRAIEAVGIDQDTALKLSDIEPSSLDAINMVEVIEHLPDPLGVLGPIVDRLKPGGVLYVESSFVDFIGDPARSDYVDPRIGHCCIHSSRSIAYLGKKLQLRPAWLNNNVVVFHKI
jgi:2-polyprenyl-3-methyl-5-hydroxy-6-metoxy-1,4-benzoquinol methylase